MYTNLYHDDPASAPFIIATAASQNTMCGTMLKALNSQNTIAYERVRAFNMVPTIVIRDVFLRPSTNRCWVQNMSRVQDKSKESLPPFDHA